MPRKSEYKQIPEGTRFGRLTVRGFFGFNERRNALFECACDCGTVKPVPGSLLRSGGVGSCGCAHVDRMRQLSSTLAVDLSGMIFGKLKVVCRLNKVSTGGSFIYRCECECGKICEVPTHLLTGGHRTNCTAWACRNEIAEVLREMELPSPNPIKDAYFGGHFDGEGSVGFQGEHHFPHLVARVSICYKPTILEYQEAFGGSVTKREVRGGMLRTQWCWQVSAQHEVLRFIGRILPYSTEKKPQLELGRDYLLERIKYQKRKACPSFVSSIPTIKAQMCAMKQFEFCN